MSKDFYTGMIIKYLFIVLKHVGFFVKDRFDFDNCNLEEVKQIVIHAYRMMFNPKYRLEKYPDLELNDLIALALYRLKVPYGSALFIDDVTVNHGYGFCRGEGTFQFQIPHMFMEEGTVVESCPVFRCDLESRIESIEMHAYKNRVKERKIIAY